MSNQPKDLVIGELTKNKDTLKIRVFWFAGLFSFLIAALAIIAAWQTVVVLAKYFAYALTTFTAIGAILACVYYSFLTIHNLKHQIRRDEAETRRKENEAAIVTHSSDHVAYVVNGGQLFPIYSPQLRQPEMLALPSGGVQSLDFLEVMTKSRRCYSLIGDQQTGKSTLCHYLVEYWQQRNIKSIVIAQKFDANEYLNCEKFGPDNQQILAGFELIKAEAITRQNLATNGTPYSDLAIQPVFLEDFTSFASIIEPKELESFVSQALTVYAARGLLLYFIVHSRNKNSFGLGKQGASLKEQMTRLEIIPSYFQNGEIDHNNKKILCSIGSNLLEVPVVGLPTHTPNLNYPCELSLYAPFNVKEKIEPNKLESTILRRYDQGLGISQIALAVYGLQNGYNNTKIKEILEKFGREVKDQRVKEF